MKCPTTRFLCNNNLLIPHHLEFIKKNKCSTTKKKGPIFIYVVYHKISKGIPILDSSMK